MSSNDTPTPEAITALFAAAQQAARQAYAPYSGFHVGAALLFADGAVVTGANVENASYGLTLCAETAAIAKAANGGRRGGLVAVAVLGGRPDAGGAPITDGAPVTPCGRCRQMINEWAQLGDSDPVVYCLGGDGMVEYRLSTLLPDAFGPASLK